jgi:adenylate cyclase
VPFYMAPMFAVLVLYFLKEIGPTSFSRHVAATAAWISLVVSYYYANHIGPSIPIPEYSVLWARPIMHGVIYSTTILIVYYTRHEADISKSALNSEREKNATLHAESEKLLLNILPAEVSRELKSQGHTTPREYSSTTVLFTDFVGFTRIAERLTAIELVRELDQCFSYFDTVTKKYGLEKLKTIGDAYMAAGGIPVENNTHPIDCALAALEIQAFMNQMKDIKEQQELPYWELRLGMHTGPLVAGVVGEMKFAYDVWGDTVNTASRMESSGVPGAINISRELYDQIHFLFKCEYRGKVYAKNKGEIEMYFLLGLKPKFSVHREGRVPNGEFKDIYEKVRLGARLVKKVAN